MSAKVRSLLSILLVVLTPGVVQAGWPYDPNIGAVPVCTASGNQSDPTIVPDGSGGVIVTWADSRFGGSDIFAQRLNAAGVPQWNLNGVEVCTAANDQSNPTIVSDGAGGAIVTWYDNRNGVDQDIYVQRLDAAGAPQWTANGVALCTSVGEQFLPTIVSDVASGAIVTWYDSRSGSFDIYAQRVNAAGTPQWTANGLAICTATSIQVVPAIAPDGAGGAIITWSDFRSANYDIYAQRVNGGGAVEWTSNGVALCTATFDQQEPAIIADGAGGAIVTWYDNRSGNSDIYAQRVSPAGTVQWTVNGVALCTATGTQTLPSISSDGSGGAIVAWPDARSGTNDIYAQRVSASGVAQWTANGVALCTAAGNQSGARIVAGAVGGAIVTWWDQRSGVGDDVFAQSVSASGVPQWTANGVAVSTAVGVQQTPVLAADGAGGAIITWRDSRSGNNDIYAQRVERFGYLGGPAPVIASVLDVPNDQGGKVKVAWYPSYLDGLADPNLASYDLYRSAPGSVAFAAARQGARISSSFAEPPIPGERSFVVETPGIQLYAWEYIASTTPVHFLDAYGHIASTTGDSTGNGNPPTIFMVVGRNSFGSMYWLSAPDSGYSVDNLAPAAPQPFTGTYAGGSVALHWGVSEEPDFAVYRLYRGSSADFVPGPGNLVATSPDTGYVDAPGTPSYYKLSAVDVHGNESPFALLTPPGTVAVPLQDRPLTLRLWTPQPNPARSAARIDFDLPHAAPVSLQVYDAGGRRVRTLLRGRSEAGRASRAWDLCDDGGNRVSSGIYFVRFEALGRSMTQRMAVMP